MPPIDSIDESLLRFEDYTVDDRRGLYRGAERIRLTPTPCRALEFLARNRGRVVSKEELLDAVWGGQRDENTVEQAIRQIRRALGDEKENPRFIQTIPGQGYCFIAAVAEKERPQPEPEALLLSEPAGSTDPKRRRVQRLIRKAVLASTISICLLLVMFVALLKSPARIEAVNPSRLTRSQAVVLSPLLIDGSEIAYPRYENGRYSIAETPVKGGERTTIASNLLNPELCDVTRDGSAMLLRNLVHSRNEDEPLYVQERGGMAHRVGNILAYDAAWFPNAKRILYSDDGAVYSTDISGKSRRRLFSVPGHAYWFRWSPDGKKLRFTVINRETEDTSIWELDAGSSESHRVFPKLAYYQCCGTWTPDGRFFLFQARVGNTFQIWARREERYLGVSLNKQPFPLIYGAASYRGPLVSRDGKRLFLRAENPKGELMRYDYKSRDFVPMLPSISARTLTFSKDGNWIAYTTLLGDNLWRCRVDGTQCIQLAEGFRNTLMPRWSPDGRLIAFMGVHFTGNWGIYTVPAKGGPIRCLFSGSQAEGFPDWSPDGQHLVFSEVVPVAQPEGVHILDLRTDEISTLPGSKGFFLPRWSPDGSYIVALQSSDRYPYLFDFATKTWRVLAKIPGDFPNWSHDGKNVYFLADAGENRTVYRVALAGQSVQKVASLESVEPNPFILGDWMGLAPDDAPLAVQDMTTDDIYAWNLTTR